MKKLLSIIGGSLFLVGCINSSTNFSNRGVTYQVTPELLGDQAYVSNSPTTADATVNAEKTNELKTNAGQTVTDSSTNEQKASVSDEKKDETKSVETPVENVKDTQDTPEN